jgi:uncharacterized membrane protein
VAAFTVVGLVLRLLLVRSVWVDEAIEIHQVHLPLGEMLHQLRATDNHPPLTYIIQWWLVRVFGYGDLAIHLQAIAEGTLLIPMLYLTGRELFGRRTALTAAGLIAIAPLAIWYSQEARDYAMFMLLATAAVWAQVRALRDGRARYWIAYAAATVALLYTHYFSVLPIAVQQLGFAGVAWRRRREGRSLRDLLLPLWLCWAAIALALLPLAPFVVTQVRHDQASGLGFSDGPVAVGQATHSTLSIYSVLSNALWALWGYHSDATMLRLAALWPLLMLVALALLGRGRRPQNLFVLALAVLPMAVLLVVGLSKHDLFEVRYAIASVPFGVLLCARAVSGFSERRGPVLVATALFAVTMLVGLADQQLNHNNPRTYDFRDALTAARSRAQPGDIVLYAPSYLEDVLAYYSTGLAAKPLSGTHPRVPGGHRGVFLLVSFLTDPRTDSQVGAARYALAHSGRRGVVRFRRPEVELLEYR